jgi:hypothetical protein
MEDGVMNSRLGGPKYVILEAGQACFLGFTAWLGAAFFLFALLVSCVKNFPSTHAASVMVEAPGISPHPALGTRFLLINVDPVVLFTDVQSGGTYSDQEGLVGAYRQKVENRILAQGTIDKSGIVIFKNVSPGHYWAVNPEPVRLKSERLLWAHPIAITASGPSPEVRLGRSNAALVMEETNFNFR